jgi:hypothetical protein
MALIVRIDVDRPYGKQGLVRHVASRIASDFFLPRMEWLRYLDELKTILRILNANGKIRSCVLPEVHLPHTRGVRTDGGGGPSIRPSPGELALGRDVSRGACRP